MNATERRTRLTEIMRDVVIPDGAYDSGTAPPLSATAACDCDGNVVTIHAAGRKPVGGWRTGPVAHREESSAARAARMDAARIRFHVARVRNEIADLEALAESYAEDVARGLPHTWLTPATWDPDAGLVQTRHTDPSAREAQVLATMLEIDDKIDSLRVEEAHAVGAADAARARARTVANTDRMRRSRKVETPGQAAERKRRDRERKAATRAALRAASTI